VLLSPAGTVPPSARARTGLQRVRANGRCHRAHVPGARRARNVRAVPATPILFCTHVTEVGGAEAVLLDLLGALDRDRFAPHLAAPAGGPLPERARALGVPVAEIVFAGGTPWRKAAGVPAAARELRRCATATGARLLVATSMIAGYAGVLAQRRSLPCAWHLHVVPDALVARLALRRAAAVLAPSRVALAGLGARWAARGRGVVVPNGVADRFFAAPAGSLRARLGLADATPLVGIVGRLDPRKGHEVLLAAVAALPRGLEPHVVVAGGELFTAAQPRIVGFGDRLRARVRDLGIERRVHWLGEVADTAPLYRDLDVVVVPSTTLESAPRAIAEAQAAGTAVLASAIGGTPELIADGDTGVLVPPNDAAALAGALAGVLADERTRQRIANAGRTFAEQNYRLATFARRCEQVFARALAR
jgi:glycosyltransferase involved in cell wall biosynthesis